MTPDISAEELAEEAAKRDVELTDEGYYLSTAAEKGDTAQSLAEQTSDAIPVMPVNQANLEKRGFQYQAGGRYINPKTKEDLTGKKVGNANIKIVPSMQVSGGKPMASFTVSDLDVEEIGSTGKGKTQVKVNLVKPTELGKKAGWSWIDVDDKELQGINTLISVTKSVKGKNQHFYTLETDFSKGAELKTYPKSQDEPRLRPTVVGDIELQEPVGTIKLRGREHPVYRKIRTYAGGGLAMAEGGAVPMNTMAKQMELFDEGGLMDEGGTTDPISGNEVPPGSTQEEVRDDVPAQLSEGEFVFPADVVRYIGLETLMRMRQEAKMGLAQMEAMGQMGNSEEATIPDDLPFDMYDLEVEDDGLEMQVGGSVPAAPTPTSNAMSGTPASTVGGFVNQIQPLGGAVSNLGIAPSPVTAASATQVDPNLQGTQFTPTSINPVTPTFQQQIGAGVVGVDYEFVEYTNEAGQTIRLRRNKATGQMIDPIPEGFSEKVKEETKVETTPTTGVGTQTTRVVDDGGRDPNEGDYVGATVALGGQSGTGKQKGLRTGNFGVFGVSFDAPSALPGVPGIFGVTKGLVTGQGLPADATANIFSRNDPTASVTLTAQQYNSMMATDGRGTLGEQVKTAVEALSAIKAGEFDKSNYNDLTGLSKDLVQRSTVKGLMDKVDIANPKGLVDNIRNLGTGTFSEAVDKLNDAERSVLEDMGVDLDTSLDITPEERASLAAQEREAKAAAIEAARQAREGREAPSAPSRAATGDTGTVKGEAGRPGRPGMGGAAPGGEDRGGGRDTSVDRGGPGASPDRGDTGRNTAR